ncbi:unnamed protein product [Lepeophtheirus salmonis]|uniref:(salmon louse) hypothetical protein n=1 Tax=Lepeophtheirus salmonis TaxID=72036 RepID=A0A7R8HD74_LEPSM|nr:unnamed protein product [Lepeophtheirus salmonis]CAF3028730.1 unnamed protein product [Lepeophtheirus salmonis]
MDNQEGDSILHKELFTREMSINKFRNEIQKEREISEMHLNTLIQLQRNDGFTHQETIPNEESEERVTESLTQLNKMISIEVKVLKEQINNLTKDSKILLFNNTGQDGYKNISSRDEDDVKGLSSFDLKLNIEKVKTDIEEVENDILEMKDSKNKLMKEIMEKKTKYGYLNESFLSLSNTNRGGTIYHEGNECDVYLLMENSLRFSNSTKKLIEERRLCINIKEKRGVSLKKIFICLLESYELKAAQLESSKRFYKTLGQRWILLSKFVQEKSNIIFEDIIPSEDKSQIILEIECRQPDKDDISLYHIPHHTKGNFKML